VAQNEHGQDAQQRRSIPILAAGAGRSFDSQGSFHNPFVSVLVTVLGPPRYGHNRSLQLTISSSSYNKSSAATSNPTRFVAHYSPALMSQTKARKSNGGIVWEPSPGRVAWKASDLAMWKATRASARVGE
jgi:hypothetical protein